MESSKKEKTKQKIIEAVGSIIAESGFQNLGINAIAREAGVDKVLIYRYFTDLPTLLRQFALQSNYWPSLAEFVEHSPAQPNETPASLASKVLINLLHELQKRPMTQEIIKWELLEKNELTEELDKARKEMIREGLESMKELAPGMMPPRDKKFLAVHAIVCAGLVHLLLHSKNKEEFMGLNLKTKEDWQYVEEGVKLIFESL
ncbi:MAG: TetR/AcrR family transcriptional regulator [Candidatus Caenarcaniphilales bacterium]|nr:TetR/AcrR family transcriptional regulator [Candidatus Caenarcaniphilales bacterium]